MAKAKKKVRKPTPGMLGSGGAAQAGRSIVNRQRQLDAQIDAQLGNSPKGYSVNDSDKKRKRRN